MKSVCLGLIVGLTLSCSSVYAKDTELGYDPDANPASQLAAYSQLATAMDKRILMIAGGDWCIWCHFLDQFLKSHPEIYDSLTDSFVIAKIYHGDETDNSDFFDQFPPAAGYPHFWVLDSSGKLIHSQNTLPLEDGDQSYTPQAFMDFIEQWKP